MLHYIGFILEVLDEVSHQVISIVDDLDVLANDPDNGGFGLWIVQVIEIFADIGEEAFVFVGVFPEDIADDDDCLLHYIGYFSFECFPEALYAFVCHFFKFDSTLAHGIDCFSYEFNVDFVDVLLEFVQDHENVFVVCNFGEHVKFFEFDVKRVVVVDEEDLEFLGEQQWSFL